MDKENLEQTIGKAPKVRPVPNMSEVPAGHPAKTMTEENEALSELILKVETGLSKDFRAVSENFKKFLDLEKHYGKKEKLFMAVLYHRGVTGPSGGMWDTDDEIIKEIRSVSGKLDENSDEDLKTRIENVLNRIKLMIRAETEGFLPTSFRFFTDEDWLNIYCDSFEIGSAFIEKIPIWDEGEKFRNSKVKKEGFADGKLITETGALSFAAFNAVMKMLPVDITFIDKDDITRFFLNERHLFDRPRLIIDKSVYGCHPTRIFPAIETMIDDFKSKKRRSVKSLRMIKGRPVSVDYIAVYDAEDEYMGTVEIVQDHSRAFEFFKMKNG